jgi:hypothetical protein
MEGMGSGCTEGMVVSLVCVYAEDFLRAMRSLPDEYPSSSFIKQSDMGKHFVRPFLDKQMIES